MTCPACGQRLMPCSQTPLRHPCTGHVHALTGLHGYVASPKPTAAKADPPLPAAVQPSPPAAVAPVRWQGGEGVLSRPHGGQR